MKTSPRFRSTFVPKILSGRVSRKDGGSVIEREGEGVKDGRKGMRLEGVLCARRPTQRTSSSGSRQRGGGNRGKNGSLQGQVWVLSVHQSVDGDSVSKGISLF